MTTDGVGRLLKHEQIAADLRRRLREGEFAIGDLLPGISDLESEYGAALNTVRRAEAVLRDEGLIRITQGIGAEVIALPQHDVRELVNAVKTAVARLEAALDSDPRLNPGQMEDRA